MSHAPRLIAPSLETAGVRHGFFGRAGGVSAGVYRSLNAGPGSDDDPAAVRENRTRCAATLGVPSERLLTGHQVHGADVAVVDGPWRADRPKVDALVAKTPGLALGVLAADCMPALFVDPGARVIGAAHAGWRGALAGVLEATVATMVGLGAAPARIRVAIGPCLRRQNFEVGLEFEAAFVRKNDGAAQFFHPAADAAKADEKRQFDATGFARWALLGVDVPQVEIVGPCTLDAPEDYFSNRASRRADAGDYGRNLSAIALSTD